MPESVVYKKVHFRGLENQQTLCGKPVEDAKLEGYINCPDCIKLVRHVASLQTWAIERD
jgi:hypothetical protein